MMIGGWVSRVVPDTRQKTTAKSLTALCIIFLFSIGAGAAGGAERNLGGKFLENQEGEWQITADKMTYVEKQGLVIAEGNVTATRDGLVLRAERAVYNRPTEMIEVTGDVRLESNGDYLTGESGIFDLRTQTGRISGGRLFMSHNNFHVNGESMERVGPDTYLVKDARLTTCDATIPAWSITASEVKVTIEGYGVVKDALFKIHDIPVFWLPYALFPAKTERQSGFLTPAFGLSNRNGTEFELPFFWAISQQTDATFYERYLSKRGLMQGVEWRYVAEKESKSVFLFDFLYDRISTKDLSDPAQASISPFERTNQTRYWFRSMTDQALPLDIQARLDTDYVSDQDYLREFQISLFGYRGRPNLARDFGRPVEEITSPFRTSQLRLSRDQSEYSLQAHSAYYQRMRPQGRDDTPEPIGGATFSLLSRPVLNDAFYFRLRSDYDYIWRDVGDKGSGLFFGPEVTRTFWLSPYVEFQPSVGYARVNQFYESQDGASDQQSRDAFDFRTRLSSVAERVFDLDWGETKKLKHKISPTLTYEYRGYHDEAKYKPWFEPLDAENQRRLVSFSRTTGQATDPTSRLLDQIDANKSLNVAAFSLANFFDAKNENAKGEVSYKQWGTLEFVQGYDLDEARREEPLLRERRPFEPLMGILTYHPVSSVSLDSEVWWDHYEGDIALVDSYLEYSLRRAGGRTDRYGLEYLHVPDKNETIGYRIHVNVTESIAAGTSLQRELTLNRDVNARYYVQYLSQCWGMRLSLDSFAGINSVMISFTVLGMGQMGNW